MMSVNIIGVVGRQHSMETNKCRVLCPHNTKERGV